jgi:hypothetical protein
MEDPLVLAQRAICLGVPEAGKKHLEQWEKQQPLDIPTLYTLSYTWKRLGELERALSATELLCELQRETNNDYPGTMLQLPQLHLTLGQPEQAGAVLEELGELLNRHPDWRVIGRGGTIVEEMFDLVRSPDCPSSLRTKFWKFAQQLMEQPIAGSVSLFEKAVDAAHQVGDAAAVEQYQRLAAKAIKDETERINTQKAWAKR